jgi:hypothetical protein
MTETKEEREHNIFADGFEKGEKQAWRESKKETIAKVLEEIEKLRKYINPDESESSFVMGYYYALSDLRKKVEAMK